MAPCKQFVLKVLLGTVFLFSFVNSQTFELAISHINDVNGQIEAFVEDTHNSSKAPKPCPDQDGKDCIGGLTNLVHWLYELKGDGFDFTKVPNPNVLRLSSGNLIGGESGWISAVENGWKDYAALVKDHIKPTFTALGMKEFGAGLRQTITFSEEIGETSKNVTGVANTCGETYKEDPEKKFCDVVGQKYGKVTLKETVETPSTAPLAEYEVGIIGFVTPNVDRLSLPGELKFSDVAESIKKITDEATDIKTFIAVGDGNFDISKQIIDTAPKVKLVVYGAGLSNTNISTYPLEYNKGFIATAGRYGSSVGKLHLELDGGTGDITLKNSTRVKTGKPDELNGDADKVKAKVDKWAENVNAQKEKFIGNSRVTFMGGETCWRGECIIGNLMTDAVVHCVLNRFDFDNPFQHVLHSIWHGGAFFEDEVNGKISEFDVHKWLPYHNNVHLVSVKGANLRKVFETSAAGIDPEKFKVKDWRQFLQVSNGFKVSYDIQSDAPKVTSIKIVHDNQGVPKFTELDNNEVYHLAIPTYLYEGRGVYNFTSKDFWTQETIPSNGSASNVFDDQCLEDYIRVMRHISVGLEERIWIDNGDGGSTETPPDTTATPTTTPNPTSGDPTGSPCPTGGPVTTQAPCPKRQKTAVTVTLTIVFYTLVLAISYVGYFYVLPRLRRPPLSEQYPPNQL